jgi:hypothetical protein
MASAGHRKNILDPAYTQMGSGYARGGRLRFYVQDFATVQADPAPVPDPAPEPGLRPGGR